MLDTFAMANLLKGEYKEAFTKIDMYGGMGNVNQKIYEDRIINLYDIFVEAQKEGKPVEKIVGNDIEKFCKMYYNCKEEIKWYEVLMKRLSHIMIVVFIYCIFEYYVVLDNEVTFRDAEINLLPIVAGLITGFVLIFLGKVINKQVTTKKEKVNPIPYYGIILLVFVVGVICGPILKDDIAVIVPFDITIMVSGVIAGIYCIVSLILVITKKDSDKLSKEEKAQRKVFEEEVEFQAGIIDVAKGMARRYKRQIKKHQKKNKVYSHEDFEKSIRKEISREKSYNVFTAVMLLLFPIIDAFSYIDLEKSKLVYSIVFSIVMIVIEIFIFRWFVKFNKDQNRSYNIILDSCKERDITVIEYVEQME